MYETPRTRRLKSDLKALEQLAADSSIFTFSPYGTPPDFYMLHYQGRGFWRPDPLGEVLTRDEHEVHVRLGASYPRMMPDLIWKSPIFHPNISGSGVVCLGGYGTYWVPSLALDELCSMLWDIIRYANFDETSPYNREAAAWAKSQTFFCMPIDNRPLRDKLAARHRIDELLPRLAPVAPLAKSVVQPSASDGHRAEMNRGTSHFRRPPPFAPQVPAPASAGNGTSPAAASSDVLFLGDVEILEAEIVPARMSQGDAEILYIE